MQHKDDQYCDVRIRAVNEKTHLLIVGGGRVNGESMFPGPSNGETLREL